jgi:phage terminase large subunit-like protein
VTTWRPRLVRVIAYGLAALVMAAVVVLAVGAPSPPWALADRVGVVVLGLLVSGLLHLLARCRVTAEPEGLTLVNVARVHELSWAEIVAVNMGESDPWVYLDLSDGTRLPAFGIQSSDGERARRSFGELREMVDAHTAALSPPDK